MNGIPASVRTHIIPHITPLSCAFDVSEGGTSHCSAFLFFSFLFFPARTAMHVGLLFLCVDILEMRPECVCLHSQIRISTCVQKKMSGVFVCAHIHLSVWVHGACVCVCSSKAAKRVHYLRPIKLGALFIVAGRESAACWGRQNGEGIPLNWNHVGAHIFTSAAELKTMFWRVPW